MAHIVIYLGKKNFYLVSFYDITVLTSMDRGR